MKLSEYLEKRYELVVPGIMLSREAKELCDAIAEENAASGGKLYATDDAMWREAISRAKKMEESK